MEGEGSRGTACRARFPFHETDPYRQTEQRAPKIFKPSAPVALGSSRCRLSNNLNAIPGLRVRFATPLGAFLGGATFIGMGSGPPLREMTSAASGVRQDSIAEDFAEGSPVSPFFASTAQLGVLLGEERAHPAHPVRGIGCSWVSVFGTVCLAREQCFHEWQVEFLQGKGRIEEDCVAIMALRERSSHNYWRVHCTNAYF
jgi:hypothetical protein